MPARSGKGRQRKGRTFERRIIQDLWKIFEKTPPWKPHARPDDGYVPPPELGAMHFEMKNQATIHLKAWWKQTKEDRQPGQAPVLILALNPKETLVVMGFEDWQWLVHLAFQNSLDQATSSRGILTAPSRDRQTPQSL